jgi:hypothetical protein
MRFRMSNDPTVSAELSTAPRVAAVVSAADPALLRRCLDAIAEQVYGAARVFVVGGDDEIRHVAGEYEAMWRPNLRAAVGSIGPEFTFVWALREQALPDRQALRALVQDAMRVDASVAGSKIVDADRPELLVSVGYGTDVFDAPYSGLQPGEVDQSQYDVIRDVAAVSGVSVLIRRDLYRGLGGIDSAMAPTAAAIDFCQRARLRGARVVVIPESVVGYDGYEDESEWRERAGEIRAMIKSYSLLTLVWSLPLALLIGLVEGVARIPLGKFPLPGVLAAWLWNIPRLPSAIRQRMQVRRGRETGDEELFRYQVAGSARLRLLWDDGMIRIRDRFPEGVLSGFADAVEAGQQRIQRPAFFVASLIVLFALVATREVWTEHLPIVGFSLPPPDSAVDTLGAYAGGWNPAGLGSPEVLRPSVAAVALVQLLAFGKGGLAVALITVGSFLLGAFGLGRLLRMWGVGSVAGHLAGATLMAGPAMIVATGATHWTAIPAIAAIPWALRAALAPRAQSAFGRLSALAGASIAVGIVGAFLPFGILVPLIAMTLWAVLGVGERTAALGRMALATVLALPLLMPWLLYVDLGDLVGAGIPAYWSPTLSAVIAVAAAAAGAILAGNRTVAAVGAWGAVLAVIGLVVARTGTWGAGHEVMLAGVALSAVGVAVAVGAGLEAAVRRREVGGWRSLMAIAGGVGAAMMVVTTVVLAGPGRAGLPHDELTGTFAFAAPPGSEPSRVLVFGPEATLPGTAREIDGLGYRVFVPPYPYSWESELNEPRLGDDALHAVLQHLLDGRTRRVGSALAEFGVGWIAFTEPSPLEALFESQLDLVTLRSLRFPVFRNESVAVVAASSEGSVWLSDGTGFVAPESGGSGDVFIASNADLRWGPGTWQQSDWGNLVATDGSTLSFAGYGPRRLAALAALAWLLALSVVAVAGRSGRSS